MSQKDPERKENDDTVSYTSTDSSEEKEDDADCPKHSWQKGRKMLGLFQMDTNKKTKKVKPK